MYYSIRNARLRDDAVCVWERTQFQSKNLFFTVQIGFASFLLSFDKQLLHKKTALTDHSSQMFVCKFQIVWLRRLFSSFFSFLFLSVWVFLPVEATSKWTLLKIRPQAVHAARLSTHIWRLVSKNFLLVFHLNASDRMQIEFAYFREFRRKYSHLVVEIKIITSLISVYEHFSFNGFFRRQLTYIEIGSISHCVR